MQSINLIFFIFVSIETVVARLPTVHENHSVFVDRGFYPLMNHFQRSIMVIIFNIFIIVK